jgi:hypothetical protein
MRTAPALLVALIATLALAGCVPDDDPVVLDPEPTVTPIFESDEEALAAAEEAYGAYSAASSQITMEGGRDPERIGSFVSPDMLKEQLEGFALYSEAGWHTSEPAAYDSFVLQQHNEEPGLATIVVYVCVDVSTVRILDDMGSDVTPPARPERVPLEVEMEFVGPDEGLLTRSELWGGEDFCM